MVQIRTEAVLTTGSRMFSWRNAFWISRKLRRSDLCSFHYRPSSARHTCSDLEMRMPGPCQMVSLARALDGVTAQARQLVPLDEAQARARRGRPGQGAAARRQSAGLPRTQPGCAGALRGPASAWRADLDGVRGERSQ